MGAQNLFKIIASVVGALVLVYVAVEAGVFSGSAIDKEANLLVTIPIDAIADSGANSAIVSKNVVVANVVAEVDVAASKSELKKEILEIPQQKIILDIVPSNTANNSDNAIISSPDDSSLLPTVAEPQQNISSENSQPQSQEPPISNSEILTPQPTPESSAPIISGVGHIVISEILFDAEGSDTGKEFIELYNPTDQVIDLSLWSIQHLASSGSLTKKNFVSGNSIPARGFFLIWLGNDSRADMQWPSGSLNNTSATIYLVDNQTLISTTTTPVAVDAVNYDISLLSGFLAGQSLERKAFNGVCISSQGVGESLGNGCDNDVISDFELRSVPNPQNTVSLSEP